MTLRTAVLALGLAASIALSASAADTRKTNAANRKAMHEYAACVIKTNRARASEAILANADNSTITRRYSSLMDGDCLGRTAGEVQMSFEGDLYRYALADALVNAASVARSESTFADRLPLAHLPMPERSALNAELAKAKSRRQRERAQSSFDRQNIISWMSHYGECVVREDPVKARLWILTPPGGSEETSRINELRPAFSACLGNGTVKFDRINMRGTVAINYYRLAMATPVPTSGKTQ